MNDDYLLKYPLFTRELKNTHTILMPSMLPFHFELIKSVIISCGYKAEILTNENPEVVKEGLKYVHNDTCYPALLLIGQLIDALKHRDDVDNVAYIITQTGGGCRATNYVPLIRKALAKAGFPQVPVTSLNMGNIEEGNGIEMSYGFATRIVAAMFYGDTIMYLYNKTRSYVNDNRAIDLANRLTNELSEQIINKKGGSYRHIKKNLNYICQEFDKLEISNEKKPKVGIVGEIYVKYSKLGNNDLENFLVSQGAEVMVPGVFSFIMYCIQDDVYDYNFYGGKKKGVIISKLGMWYLTRREKLMIKAIKKTKFPPMQSFKNTTKFSDEVISHAVKMGEGWLLTAEMVELVHIGYKNIVCAQPFGCLPNHICGKGVMQKIKQLHPEANIVAIDYDPSATKVNQDNRIKLMLAIAKEKLNKENKN